MTSTHQASARASTPPVGLRRRPPGLALFPNVSAQASGIATDADLMSWTAGDIKRYVGHMVYVFGEDRIACGGDWPPRLTAISTYARWVHALDDLTTGIGAAGQRKLFGDIARSFYRLPSA